MNIKVKQKSKDCSTEIKIPQKKRDKRIAIPDYDKVKKVTGIFKNLEFQGSGITFPYRGGWKGPIKNYTFFDGGEYVIPKELADHLNNNCAYTKLKWISTDGKEIVNARPVTTASMPNFKKDTDTKIHRFVFQILGDAS